MSHRLPIVKRDHLLNDKGPYRTIVVDKASTTAEPADGSWDKPYTTIQAGLDALPTPGGDPEHGRIGTAIHIMGGEYDEDPKFSGSGIVILVPHGIVKLVGPALATRDFTYSITGGDPSILFIQSPSTDGFTVSGNLILTGGFGLDIDATGLLLEGNLDTSAMTGACRIELENSKLDGAISGSPTTDIGVLKNTEVSGVIVANKIDVAQGCVFKDDITVTAAGFRPFSDCAFEGPGSTFTGPMASLNIDAICDYSFVANGWVTGGPVVKFVVGGGGGSAGPHDLLKTVMVDAGYTGTIKDGTHQHPFPTIQEALDSFPAPTPATHEALGGVMILVEGGIYDEDLVLPSAGLVLLAAVGGQVQLGLSGAFGLPAGPPRNVTRAVTAPPLTAYNLTVFAGLTRTSWLISGNLELNDGAVPNVQHLIARNVTVMGDFDASTAVASAVNVDAEDCSFYGPTLIEGGLLTRNSSFGGNVTVSGAVGGSGELRAWVTQFGGNVEILDQSEVVECRFAGTYTVLGGSTTSRSHIRQSEFNGVVSMVDYRRITNSHFWSGVTFTGPAIFTALLEGVVFDGTVSMVEYIAINGCTFFGDITLSGGVPALSYSAFTACVFDGITISGAPGTLRCDAASWNSFLVTSSSLAGGLLGPDMVGTTERAATLWIPGALFKVADRAAITHGLDLMDPHGGGSVPGLWISAPSPVSPKLVSPPIVPESNLGTADTSGWAVTKVTAFYRLEGGGVLDGTRGVDIVVMAYNHTTDQIVGAVESSAVSNGTQDLTIPEQKSAANVPAAAAPDGYKKLTLNVTAPVYQSADQGRTVEITPDFSGAPTITEFWLLGCRVELVGRT